MSFSPLHPFSAPVAEPGRESSLDDTIESSFPASDPPSSIPDPEPCAMSSGGSVASGAMAHLPGVLLCAGVGAVAVGAFLLARSWRARA